MSRFGDQRFSAPRFGDPRFDPGTVLSFGIRTVGARFTPDTLLRGQTADQDVAEIQNLARYSDNTPGTITGASAIRTRIGAATDGWVGSTDIANNYAPVIADYGRVLFYQVDISSDASPDVTFTYMRRIGVTWSIDNQDFEYPLS